MSWLYSVSTTTAEWVESVYSPLAAFVSSLHKLWTQMSGYNWEDQSNQNWGSWVDM